ncbi:MAG: nucleoside triphosphate pyrophosphohydrolase [Anaerolineae bacterium]|nr:nucleoside triphosphate pyrophosphohydrolase [Anaerolineae bacterium]
MSHITIVGLGPGAFDQLTQEAITTLSQASEVWLRTARHPVVPHLPAGPEIHSFDALYEESETFEEVYATIARQVLALGARTEGVVYAVPGHPLVGESTVTQILKAAREDGISTRIVPGLSFIEPALTALALDALDGLQIVDALDVIGTYYPILNPDVPVLIAQVYSRAVASDLKLVLMNLYPDEHQVALVDAVGTAAETVIWCPLYEIDHRDHTSLTSLYVTSLPYVGSFEHLLETVAHLRSPEGCPWDREQTHASLRETMLEETYEVLEALDWEDDDALCEELGDLLLQVVMHAQIAGEEGVFQMADVVAGIDAKLKRRHPHVWGEVQVSGAHEVIVNWETIKREERKNKGNARAETPRFLLDGVPKTLPALAQARAYSSRAARVGLDKVEIAADAAHIQQVMETFLQTYSVEDQGAALGEVLFAIAQCAGRLELDPEAVLREANLRFARRMRYVEQIAREQGVALASMDAAESLRLWRESANESGC